MTRCIDPTAIEEGDLMAYLEGEADQRVREHVERCPACQAEVQRLRETSQALVTLMYRADCPAPEILAQYHMDLLSSSEQLEVAAHVRRCRHCAHELEEFAAEEARGDGLTRMALSVLQGVVQTIEATMVPRGRQCPAGVRGVEDGPSAFHFSSDEVDVVIGLQPPVPGAGTRTLLGAVVQAKAVSGGRAWLFRTGEEPVASPVDRLGTFTFEALPSGTYDLALEVGRKALLMRDVEV